MNKTKIEWCDSTWNPIWGCLRGCEYCYARKIARRFYLRIMKKEFDFCNKNNIKQSYLGGLQYFKPTWLESNFQKKFPKSPKRIFVDSMSDICYWQPEWMSRVIDKIKEYPQHIFLPLTKNPMTYESFHFPENCYLGTTIINQKQMTGYADMLFDTTFDEENKIFISIEPIQEKIQLYVNPDWLIVGMETGNRRERIYPKVEWIQSLREHCYKNNIPFFMKDNLKPIWKGNLIQEFPK